MTEQVTDIPTAFARVGSRYHIVPADSPAYRGQPEVALCGTVFIRAEDQEADRPACRDCWVREADLLDHTAREALARAEAIDTAFVAWEDRKDES